MDDPPLLAPTLGLSTALVLIPITALLTVLSALLERSGHIRLRHWVEEAGGRPRQLWDHPARFSAFRLLVAGLARAVPLALVLATGSALAALGTAGWWWALLAVGLMMLAMEWLVRWLVEHHAEPTLRVLTVVARALILVLWPVIWVARFLMPAGPTEEWDDDEASEEEIAAYIDVGRREGILEPEEEELVRSIVDFGDTQVRSVMTPRVEVVSGSVEASLEELAAIFFESKHARLPIYRGSVDQVVGILHIRDLFEAMHCGETVTPESLVKAPLYVPESKTLNVLLGELQALHQQMAIVVDEYGGVAGLVTVEDLVEEIVGDINDEHEATGTIGIRLEEGRWRFAGRTYLEDLAETFDLALDLDEMPYETVSGLICGELGYVPKLGELFEHHELKMTVEEADERRVLSVLIEGPVRQQAIAGEG